MVSYPKFDYFKRFTEYEVKSEQTQIHLILADIQAGRERERLDGRMDRGD